MRFNRFFVMLFIGFLVVFSSCSGVPGSSDDSGTTGGGTTEGEDATTTYNVVFSPTGGTYTNTVTVSLSATPSATGVRIFYTTDTSEPTCTSTEYTSSLTFTSTTTLKAVVCAEDDSGSMHIAGNIGTETYTVNISYSWYQDAYIKSPDNSVDYGYFGTTQLASPDQHGPSMAVSSDGSTLVIGESGYNSKRGRVNVYTLDSGNWVLDAKLTPADINTSYANANDYFGVSVAVNADGTVIVVGSPRESSNLTGVENTDNTASTDNTVSESGAVYIYKKSGSTWVLDAFLKASNAGSEDFFGMSVGVNETGDIVIAGAPNEDADAGSYNSDDLASGDDTLSNSGAVYIFRKDASGDWYQDAYLKASNRDTDDQFGEIIAISGSRIVVGVPHESSDDTGLENTDAIPTSNDNNSTDSGAVYVFKYDSGNWKQDAFIKADEPDASDYFGFSVDIDDDIIVVGAYNEDSDSSAEDDNSLVNSGAAYVYEIDTNGDWQKKAYLKASNLGSGDLFGGSVAVDDEIIVVGARFEDSTDDTINNSDGLPSTGDNSGNNTGAAYIFKKNSSGTWVQDAYLKAPNPDDHDDYGSSVAIGNGVIIINSPGEQSNTTGINNNNNEGSSDNSLTSAGACYVVKKS